MAIKKPHMVAPAVQREPQPASVKKAGWLRRKAPAIVAVTALMISGGAAYRSYRTDQRQDAEIAAAKSATDKQQLRLNRLLGVMSGLDGIDPGIIDGSSLRDPTDLPGYKRTVSAAARTALEASLVKIGRYAKNDPAATIAENCSGNKVRFGGRVYVASAAHCFTTTLPNVASHGGPGPLAINIAPTSAYTYVVLDPNKPLESRDMQPPLATATGVALDTSERTDWALMEVTGTPGFDRIQALDLSAYTSTASDSPRPTPGQQVALSSMPASANDKVVHATGVYLGRGDHLPGTISEYVDFVGVKAANAATDPCNYGASGSQMAWDGGLSGPLTFRNSTGYENGTVFVPPDTRQGGWPTRIVIEGALHVDTQDYDTVCGYSVPDNTTVPNFQQVLADSRAVIPYPDGMK